MSADLQPDLDWLFARQRFGIKAGLERVRALLEALDSPQRHFEAVLVGGTNGKGSTAATLASMAQAGGRRVGLFTSPHLTRFAERFVVDGQELPEKVVLEALARVRPLAEVHGATFFEIVTALGCLLFAEAGVKLAVMEVGLGGKLDSTNVLEPVLSVVTNVALDHTAILGDTPEAIAREKAGILRPERPAVVGVSADLLPIFQATGADLWGLGWHFGVGVRSLGWQGSEVTVTLPRKAITFQTPLLGPHGAQNAALAAVAAWRLGLGEPAIVQGAEAVRWPARLEVLPFGAGRILLDGAHNPAGAQALVSALRTLGVGPVPLIFGAADDKDIAGVAAALRPIASRVVLTRAALSPRAAAPERLADYFAGLPVTLTQTPAEALSAVEQELLSVACGSLYLLGELRPLLLGELSEGHERWQ
ncbi:folylpolyglutamate synthase [Deinococcus xinjiangensis]|uniref:tetrahydrofolate synthase n=1 Tax=Deinococcus xinjiangensis TaxID=457454 RepID=A0ABP9VGI8_9DEIO